MKLVFYSGGDQLDNKQLDRALLSLSEKKSPKLAFIPSCHFHGGEDFNEVIDHFKPLGIKRFIKWEVDTNYAQVMRREVFNSDIIYLGGGNTYYFLKHLRKHGLLKELRSWVKNGGILCGLSAGAIIMTMNIDTAGFPSFDKDENEDNMKNLSAMDLVDFSFFPHYKNSKRYDQELSKYSSKINSPLYACPDGSGIVINGKEFKVVGKTACFFQGKKFFVNKG